MKLKFGDYIIIIFVVLITFLIAFSGKTDGDKVVIKIDGETVKTLDLGVDCEYDVLREYSNKIIIKDGSVYIKESDCPDKTCVHIGKISKSGQVICCLPNKLVITVISDKTEVDVVTG